MAQVSDNQAPQVPQEVMDRIGVRFSLIGLSFSAINLMLSGCLTPPEASMINTWHRWASEALDHNDIDKAVEWSRKILNFLEEREKLCEELRRKSRKYGRRYPRKSPRH